MLEQSRGLELSDSCGGLRRTLSVKSKSPTVFSRSDNSSSFASGSFRGLWTLSSRWGERGKAVDGWLLLAAISEISR